MKIPIKIPQKNVATKLEGGKALVAGPLNENYLYFFAASQRKSDSMVTGYTRIPIYP